MQNFLSAFQAGQRLRDLRTDVDDLHDGRNQKTQKEGVSKETANGECPRHDLVGAHVHDDRAHHSHQQAGGKAHDRCGSQSLHHVVQQTAHAAGEDFFLAFLSVITLDHADAAERFRQPARNFGIDLSTLPENWTDRRERLIQSDGKAEQKAECQQGHDRTDAKQHDHRYAGGQHSSNQIDQSGTEQISDSFYVGHDARDQGAASYWSRRTKPADARCGLALSRGVQQSAAGRLSITTGSAKTM